MNSISTILLPIASGVGIAAVILIVKYIVKKTTQVNQLK